MAWLYILVAGIAVFSTSCLLLRFLDGLHVEIVGHAGIAVGIVTASYGIALFLKRFSLEELVMYFFLASLAVAGGGFLLLYLLNLYDDVT